MKLELGKNKDFLSGLLLIGFGAMGMYMALDYPFGTALRMGPGYFPRVLSGIMIAFGLYIGIRGLITKEKVEGIWGWKPLAFITAALWAFGWMMDRTGLILALIVLIFVAARAGHEFKFIEVTIMTVILVGIAYGIFIYGLGLPYPLVWWQ